MKCRKNYIIMFFIFSFSSFLFLLVSTNSVNSSTKVELANHLPNGAKYSSYSIVPRQPNNNHHFTPSVNLKFSSDINTGPVSYSVQPAQVPLSVNHLRLAPFIPTTSPKQIDSNPTHLPHVKSDVQTISVSSPEILRSNVVPSSLLQGKYQMPLVPRRPRNVSRSVSPHYPWGSHEFGPLQAYASSPPGTKWVAYFDREAIAVILEGQNEVILNCTLLEVIQEYEQTAALKALGQVMPLVPLSLQKMTRLNSYCSNPVHLLPPKTATPKTIFSHNTKSPEDLLHHASTILMGILPGTVWCGMGDQARVFHQLGYRSELDRCCRAHDHCPVKVRAGVTKYGATNNGISTVSHCSCDQEFLHCLEEASNYDHMASIVGQLFFNILRPQCLRTTARKRSKGRLAPVSQVDPLRCLLTDSEGKCRQWESNPSAPDLEVRIVSPNFEFKSTR